MRILILSCIHSNLAALEAVLKDAKGQWDMVWCVGNVVGYGLEPNECIELLQTLPHVGLKGLFEEAALGRCDLRTFNAVDRFAAEWTQNALKPEHIPYLRALFTRFKWGDYTLAHASPREPLTEYITDPLQAVLLFPHFETLYYLSGRLPRPAIYEQVSEEMAVTHPPRYSEPHALNGRRKIIVLGGVGVSGTQTPQYAEYGLLDTEKTVFEFRRCVYDVASVLNRLRAASFHPILIKTWENGNY